MQLKSAVVLVLVTLLASTVRAQTEPEHRLVWRSEWRRVGIPEYAVTTALLGGFFAVYYAVPPAEEPLWTRPLPFDHDMRGLLRRESVSGRNLADTISDVVAIASHLPPLVIDPFIIAGFGDGNLDVTWQLFVISSQSYAFMALSNAVSKRLFARQRPYAAACARNPNYSARCKHHDRFRSFYSGHAAITATGAGLVCSHHTHLPLYGGGLVDTGTCLAAIAGTLVTGSLRVAADKHWLSDVAVGHIVGFAAGLLIPSLIYYKGFQKTPVEEPDERPPAARAPALPVLSLGWVL
jgi:membrane-associated phospholipid phosphatase